MLLNCGDKVGGTCSGGYPAGVYLYALERGGVEYESCQQYQADDTRGCEKINQCRQCTLNSTAGSTSSLCWGVDSGVGYGPYRHWSGNLVSTGKPKATLKSWGFVSGASDMQAEILLRGPIACLVESEPLRAYKGGVFKYHEFSGDDHKHDYDHALVVTGWGESDDGVKYWTARNSWGAAWGDFGFVKVERNEDGSDGASPLGRQHACMYAVPDAWGYTQVGRGNYDTKYYDQDMVENLWRVLDTEHDEGEIMGDDDNGGRIGGSPRSIGGVDNALNGTDDAASAAAASIADLVDTREVADRGLWTLAASSGGALVVGFLAGSLRRRRPNKQYLPLR